MQSSGQRKLAAIMFTDIVGYSALTQRDEALAMTLLEEHFELLRSIFPRFEGIEIKTIGDAFLVEFRSAFQAAGCAIEIQKKLWERNQRVDPKNRVDLRIGLHVGDIIHSGGDVFGDGVNIAARIEPCAPAGGICLSEDLARPIRNKLEYPLVDLGEKRLKNISDPLRVFAVRLPWLSEEQLSAAAEKFRTSPAAEAGFGGRVIDWFRGGGDRGRGWRRTLAGAAAALLVLASVVALWRPWSGAAGDRLALLPLQYQGPAERSATAKMLPALLVESLRTSPELLVTPFDSSRHVPPESPADRATHELDVDWVLTGELEIVSNRYGVQLSLLDGQGRNRWEKRLDGDADQIFNVAEQVTGEIESALGAGKGSNFDALSRNQDAVRWYLEGKSFLQGWDLESNHERAREAFRKALDLDPNFGEAQAGLALATWNAYQETRDPSLVEIASQAAKRAVELIPENPEAHLALGVIQLGKGLSQEAVASFKNALDRAPANDAVCRRIGDAYMSLGRDKDAETMYQMAINLKPDFWENYRAKGNFYLARGRYQEAKSLYRRVVELRPESDVGHNNLALAHLSLGEMEEAESHLREALAIQPNFAAYTNLGFIYYSQGRYAEAVRQFQSAVELSNDHTPWLNLGDAQRQLKNLDEARKAYAKAIELASERLRINPADQEVRGLLACALAGAGQCEQAKKEASIVSRENRGQPLLNYYSGLALALCGEDAQASRELETAIRSGLLADVESNPDLRRFLEQSRIKDLIASQKKGGS